MADDKRIMKRRHENAWDTVHFTTNANHMGMNSSDMTENVNKKLTEIMTAQQVEVKPVLEDKIDIINLVTKQVLITGTPTSTAEFEVGKTETVVPNTTALEGADLLFKFYGKNLDKIQDKADECLIKKRNGSTDSTSTDVRAVTKENLAQMRAEYRNTMIDIGDYIYHGYANMSDTDYTFCLQRKFTAPTTVGGQEKDVIYSKAFKFTPPQIIAQCVSVSGDTETVIKTIGFNADSSEVVEIPHGTKKLKCYMQVNGSDPVSDKHILKLEMYNPFTHTVGNAIAAVKLAADNSQDTALFKGETKYRPYDVVEFSSEVSTISFNLSPVDSTTVSIGFSNLDGITVMRGIWNKPQARLEF